MTSFFSVKLNGFEMSLFQIFSSSFSISTPGSLNCFQYLNLSLKELILLAKTDPSAKEEFIRRNIPRIYMIVKKYNKEFRLQNVVDLFETGIDSIPSIIKNFDIKKGEVDNFITFSIKRQVLFRCIKLIREKERIAALLGSQINYKQLYKIAMPKCDLATPSKIASLVDFSSFINRLSKRDKKIFLYYLRGETITSISNKVNTSICTVSKQLHAIFNKIQKNFKYLDFNYISSNI